MKHTLLTIFSALLLIAGGKELRTLVMTPTPQMHCENCENKIKSNLRFEKGVVKIETSIPDQTVTVIYNASEHDAGISFTIPLSILYGEAKVLEEGEKTNRVVVPPRSVVVVETK